MDNRLRSLAALLCFLAVAIVSCVELLQSSAPSVLVLHPAAFFVPLPVRPPDTASLPGRTVIDWSATLKAQLEALPTGKRVFNPPNVMREGTNTRVEFRVSRGDLASLLAGLKGPGSPEVKDIKVAPLMAVSLKSEEEEGEAVFRIKPLKDSDEQLVIGDQATDWSWDVFPTSTGPHRLYLSVSVFLFPPDGGPRRQVKIEERVVTVRINPSYKLTKYGGSIFTFLTGGVGLLSLQKAWSYLKQRRERRKSRIIRT
jgi:hypothetical protein